MPDSWILIIITVLIIFILFYMSNRMICLSTAGDGDCAEEKYQEAPERRIEYIGSESLPASPHNFRSSDNDPESCNNNNNELKESNCRSSEALTTYESRVENRLRSQMFNLLLAEKEYLQLQMDVQRLANVLSTSQGVDPEECVDKFKRELSPLMEVASFHPERRSYSLLSEYLHDITTTNDQGVTRMQNEPV